MDKAKVIQIGIQGFGQYISGIVKKCSNIELVGIYDINKEFLVEAAKALDTTPYETLENVLACECDGVILEVPNSVHAELVKSAAMANKHIFVEKPITNTIEEAEEIIRLCRDRGVMLQVGHNMRFMGKYRKVKELIDDNCIGRVILIEANYSYKRGKRHTSDSWRYSRSTCPGGPMLQLGIHVIDTIYYLTGSKPLRVCGIFTDGFTPTQNDDAGVIIMKLENEILAYIGSSYVSPLTQNIVIYGDNGKIEIRDDNVGLVMNGKNTIIDIPEEDGDTSYIKQLESFANNIIRPGTPEVDGETGLQNLEVVLNALKTGGY